MTVFKDLLSCLENSHLIDSLIVKALLGAFNDETITRYSMYTVYIDVESEKLRTLVNINIPVLRRGGETQ